jgi:hypothetical protein
VCCRRGALPRRPVREPGGVQHEQAGPFVFNAVKVLAAWLGEQHADTTGPLFATRAGTPLSRDAVQHLVTRQWESARDDDSLRDLRELITSGALESFRKVIMPGRSAVALVADVSVQWSFLNDIVPQWRRPEPLARDRGRWLAPVHAAQIDEMVSRLARDPYMDGWRKNLLNLIAAPGDA